jgi:hypothetical protein
MPRAPERNTFTVKSRVAGIDQQDLGHRRMREMKAAQRHHRLGNAGRWAQREKGDAGRIGHHGLEDGGGVHELSDRVFPIPEKLYQRL